MARSIFNLAAALVLAGSASSQHCEGQSCNIAALSGSSGQPFNPKQIPQGGTNSGDCCIIRYNPAVAPELYKLKPALKKICKKKSSKHVVGSAINEKQIAAVSTKASCKPYALIFAKGTDEPGPVGITVGPTLKNGLELTSPGNWSIMGVEYMNTVNGDYCLGRPGGTHATKLLEATAKSCPDTKIVMSGYSEGAMVAHNGVAFAEKSARARVLGVVVFGDPFNGAPIMRYTNPIKTYCAKKDQVCRGLFKITPAHLSYVGKDTTEATLYISKLVGAPVGNALS